MKELKLWIFTSTVLGQHRMVLVADHTVGGAKGSLPAQHGVPNSKVAISASKPGFPSWINEPGVWIGIIPTHSSDRAPEDLRGLDRYTQDYATAPPKVLPNMEEAFVRGRAFREALESLEGLLLRLLVANHSGALYRKA